MKRIILLLVSAATFVGAVAYFTVASEHADGDSAPIFLTEVSQAFRDWRLIAMCRLTAANGSSQLRAELGNDIAIQPYREGKLPFPDGAIIAALHWNEVTSEENNKVLAKGFPGSGIQAFVPGSGVNMQFMAKDSKKHAGVLVTLPTANLETRRL